MFEEIIQSLEKWKSSAVPSIDCSVRLLDMGVVHFDVPTSQTITIRNTGTAIAYWRFVPKVEETRECKNWINLDVLQGLLLPGESSDVVVTVRVDVVTAQGLNAGKELLEDVLVLSLESGHDFFVPVTASYKRSYMGMSLEALVNAHGPVRELPLPAVVRHEELLQDNGKAAELAQRQEKHISKPPLSLPKEIWRLVDALVSGDALREKDLFAAPAVPEELVTIREALDCGQEFTVACSPHSYAHALQDLLCALPVPLLAFELYPVAEVETQQLRVWARRFLDALQPVQYNVFVYLCSFLREVLALREFNRCTEERLVELCLQTMTSSSSPNYFLHRDEIAARQARRLYMRPVLAYFLTTSSL